MRKPLWILLPLVLLFGLQTFGQSVEVPKGWRQVTACQFSFLVPSDTQSIAQRPVDSCLAAFESKDMIITLDYGWYSGPGGHQDWENEYKTSKIMINGKSVQLITYVFDTDKMKTEHPVVTQIHLITHPAGQGNPMTTSLLFTISSKKSADPSVVKRIYESLRFLGD